MALSDPIRRARAVRTPLQAARLMARLEHEISWDLTASEEWHLAADQANDELRARFPPPAPWTRISSRRRVRPRREPACASARPAANRPRRGLQRERVTIQPARWPARPRRRLRHSFEAAAVLVGLAAAIAVLARHVRRHPRHALAGGVALAAFATGRPTLIVTAVTLAAMIFIVRRRPGAVPRVPRMPRPPRMPAAPRWRK
jgi:hypothetical protein